MLLVMSGLVLLSCGKDNGDEEVPTDVGVTVTTYGVDQAAAGYEDEFVDGYEVYLDHWITDMSLGDTAMGESAWVVDWTQVEEPLELGTWRIGAGEHAFGLRTLPASDQAVRLSEIDEEALAVAISERYTHYIVGHGEGGGTDYTFAWGMKNPAVYTDCIDAVTGEPVITVTDEDVAESDDFEVTLDFHLDHLWFDRLETEAADMRFEVFAAWADVKTDEVRWDDLNNVNAAAILDRDDDPLVDEDGFDLSYSNASLALTDYLYYAVQEMVHFNGGGACDFDDP